MYIAVPRAGGLPDVNVNKFDIYCYVGLYPAMRCPPHPRVSPQESEVRSKALYWGDSGGSGGRPQGSAPRHATAATSAAPFPEPSSDCRKVTVQLGARSRSICWRCWEKLGRTGGEGEGWCPPARLDSCCRARVPGGRLPPPAPLTAGASCTKCHPLPL